MLYPSPQRDLLVDCLVTGYEPLIESVALPDPAALRSPPQTVVDLLDTLRNDGLARTVARMRAARGI